MWLAEPLRAAKWEMRFEVVGAIENVEVIAARLGIRIRPYLRKAYGGTHW